MVVACPAGLEDYGLRPFDAVAAVRGIRDALGDLPCTVLADVPGADGPPTLDMLCDRLGAGGHSLLHLVCHGRYDPGERTTLVLSAADGSCDFIDDDTFLSRLGWLAPAGGLPYLTFLCACESAAPEAETGAGGLAHRLVRELGMPAVLAMTEPISVTTGLGLGQRFYPDLRDHGHPDLALARAWNSLAGRPDVHVPALFSRLRGQPLFTDSLADRPLTAAEIERGLVRAAVLLAQRAPVLSAEFEERAVILRRTAGLPIELRSWEGQREHEGSLAHLNKLCRHALDIPFDALALGVKEPAYDDRCPFRGLYPFTLSEKEFFCGRDDRAEELCGRLAEHNFLAVLGHSGSGKSSLVLAGVLPRLVAGRVGPEFLILTPGTEPTTSLDASLGQKPGAKLLTVDQFEELFTLCPDETERRRFVERLLAEVPKRLVVLTLRDDFLGECAFLPEFRKLIEAHLAVVGPLTAAELRAVMEEQARKVGLEFEAGLGGTILNDVADEPGAMPLLQHALRELWNRRHGRWLMASEYEKLGGVRKAIAVTADKVYEVLSQSEQRQMRDIFLRLTRLGEAWEGTTRRDTRQHVKLDELTHDGGDREQTKRLVKRLAGEGARLLVTGSREGEGEVVEMAHEALIQHWPQLQRWLKEDEADMRLLAGVRDAARQWDARRTDADLLVHRGTRLVEAERLTGHARLRLNRLEADYLTACVDLRERETRQREKAALAEVQYQSANEAREETERILAAKLWQPIDSNSKSVNNHEISSLIELGLLSIGHEGTRTKFIEEALANAANSQRLARRAAAVIQAAVGLNRDVAESVRGVVRRRLDREVESSEVRTAAALALAELQPGDQSTASAAAGALLEALNKATTAAETDDLTGALVEVTQWLTEQETADLLDRAAKLLLDALDNEMDTGTRNLLINALRKVVKILPEAPKADVLGQMANLLLSHPSQREESRRQPVVRIGAGGRS